MNATLSVPQRCEKKSVHQQLRYESNFLSCEIYNYIYIYLCIYTHIYINIYFVCPLDFSGRIYSVIYMVRRVFSSEDIPSKYIFVKRIILSREVGVVFGQSCIEENYIYILL